MNPQKKSMNKIYIFVGIGAVIGIIALMAILSDSTITSMSLNQILENKDCAALEKWGEEHIYDENLSITDEQQSKIMKVGFECGMKVFNNIFSVESEIVNPQSEKTKPITSITLDKNSHQYQSGEIVKVDVHVDDSTFFV